MRSFSFICLLGILYFFTTGSNCSEVKTPPTTPPNFIEKPTPWADSVISHMTIDEQIGQLFMVPAYSNLDEDHAEFLEKLVNEYHIGGLICMQGGPQRQVEITNRLQEQSKIPLLLSMDAEWGLAMRLDSTISYPRQMALGAISDINLIRQMGSAIGEEMNRIGMHFSFSPVADINNNPNNPVINSRSFGENKEVVLERSLMYMDGLQRKNILACGKHFPGHGDTDTDSHKDLPVIPYSFERLDSIELYPFKTLINSGLASVMVAHLNIPALDSTPNAPSTLSKKIVDDLLKKKLGFEGLIITDAMNMQGIAKYFEPGEMEVAALVAGNDILLFPGDVPKAVEQIKLAILDSVVTIDRIRESCYKILKAKEWCGLNEFKLTQQENIIEDLNSEKHNALNRKLVESSLTVLENDNVIPVKGNSMKIAVLSVGEDEDNAFTRRLNQYLEFDNFYISKQPNFNTSKNLNEKLAQYDLVIANVMNTSQRVSRKFGVTQQSLKFITALTSNTKVILNLHGNPYALKGATGLDRLHGLVIGYEEGELVAEALADLIAGASTASGKLPVTISKFYQFGDGISIDEKIRIKPSTPEYSGASGSAFTPIDSIVQSGIEKQAFPGCQVAIIKDGNMVYNRSFGHYTYAEKQRVNENTIYDLASITKIAASTLSLMKLQDEQMVNVDYNLCDYLDICDTSDYFNMNLREMLSHYAKLKSWIPFYLETIDQGQPNPDLYRNTPEEGFSTEVADQLYISDSYVDSIYDVILNTSLRSKREYKYSDLGYYFVKDIVEHQTGKTLNDYCMSTFYTPMGLSTMGYLPLQRHELDEIAPTEYDMLYRKQLVQGHVHDPGAAMMGGVGGHAGLFSNATDLATLLFMVLNNGSYAGQQYLNQETIEYFTSCHYCDDEVRRGIGFDKPGFKYDTGPSCNSASEHSFGHTGFTGTVVWADPDHQLVYVFLSNRVYPNADNRKLISMNIRTDIQQVIYDAYGIPFREERLHASE